MHDMTSTTQKCFAFDFLLREKGESQSQQGAAAHTRFFCTCVCVSVCANASEVFASWTCNGQTSRVFSKRDDNPQKSKNKSITLDDGASDTTVGFDMCLVSDA